MPLDFGTYSNDGMICNSIIVVDSNQEKIKSPFNLIAEALKTVDARWCSFRFSSIVLFLSLSLLLSLLLNSWSLTGNNFWYFLFEEHVIHFLDNNLRNNYWSCNGGPFKWFQLGQELRLGCIMEVCIGGSLCILLLSVLFSV